MVFFYMTSSELIVCNVYLRNQEICAVLNISCEYVMNTFKCSAWCVCVWIFIHVCSFLVVECSMVRQLRMMRNTSLLGQFLSTFGIFVPMVIMFVAVMLPPVRLPSGRMTMAFDGGPKPLFGQVESCGSVELYILEKKRCLFMLVGNRLSL